MPYGITQCYLPPGRCDIPSLTRAEAGTRLSDPGGMLGVSRPSLNQTCFIWVFLFVRQPGNTA